MTKNFNSERESVKIAYQLFSERLEKEKFLQLLNALGDLKWNFIRACFLFQQAMKCKNCEQNVALAILCSAVESISSSQPTKIFKDWLIENKLEELSNKSKEEVRKILNRAYQEYINSVIDREGAFYNFMKFLLENCPEKLRRAPIDIYRNTVGFVQASFEDSLRFTYDRFRSLFLHRGIGRASLDLPPKLKGAHLMFARLLDKHRRKVYSTDLIKLLNWFESVVKESLFQFLIKENS